MLIRFILCTNAYTNLENGKSLWPTLAQSIVPLYSFQVATKPLSDNLRKSNSAGWAYCLQYTSAYVIL